MLDKAAKLAGVNQAVETSIAGLLAQEASLVGELERWRAEREMLDTRIGARERLLAALRSEAEIGDQRLFEPPVAAAPASAAPPPARRVVSVRPAGTGDAVMAVLALSETPMSAEEVYDALDRRGWAPIEAKDPRNAVRASLWTLAKNGKIEKLGATPAERVWALWKDSGPNQSGGP